MFKRLNTLPRDTRDTLFLLAVIAWIVAPHTDNLPVWCSVLTGGILLWRARITISGQALPSRWWLVGLMALTTLATLFSHRTLLGRDAGVTIVVVLFALKTLEMRARRDAFVIFFLGFFTMLSNFFFSQSLLTAAAMLIALLGLLTALVNSHMPVGRPPLLQAAKTAASMALLGAPIMVVLFMLFPRLAPLWGVPGDAMVGRSGLSANMQVGTIASLALDSSVAMRIKFEDTPPPQSDLYFRGPVLSSFDGREWRPLRQMLAPLPPTAVDLKVESPAVRYQVTLEPSNRPWILVLEATPDKPDLKGFAPSMNSELQWLAERPFNDLVRYTATSHPQFRYGPLKRVAGLQNDINLPEGFNPRTLTLAAEIRRASNTTDTQVLVNAALTRLRTGGYVYTLEPGVFGRDTADEFWFDRKQGFCEHIASSFVVLMRGMNVPARVVTGYQGGELNALDGFWTVRQSDAHAWAEVWMEGRGWVRVDPTAAVAPTRTGTLQRLEAPRSIFNQALVTMNPAFALNLRAFWEATNNRWNQWVLNYSQSRQLDLLRRIGFESPGWEDLSYVLIAIIVSAALVGALWTQWERSRQDPWLRLYHQSQQRLIRAGFSIAPTMPPRQMAQTLQACSGANASQMQTLCSWLLRMEAWRYAPPGDDSTAGLKSLQRDFSNMTWPEKITPP